MKKNFYKHSGLSMLFLLTLIFGATAASVKAVTIYGVTTTNQLVSFDSATPGTVTTIGAITGLQSGENVVGIDFRPATGRLVAVGSNSRLYTINTSNAAATFTATLSTALSGANFGVDFNPTVDRIRIVSNTGQNLRVNPNNGAVTVDGTLNPGTPNVTAAGYTNSVFGATTTTLYVIDSTTNSLYTQNPPNNGTLVLVGALNTTASVSNGFDIAPNTNTAYAVLTGATTNLYTVNLTTGAATNAGTVGVGLTPLRGIAIDQGLAGSAASVTLDFDGDRKTDFSVFRLNENNWYINRSSNNSLISTQFGSTNTDILTPADFDGDGKTDIAVWRTTNGVFYVLRSSDNGFVSFQWGQPGDEPVARDYDGDGKADYAVARRANGQITWLINNSIDGSFRASTFGIPSDTVAPGDYDGDGRFDLAIHRGIPGQPATFFIQQSTAGFVSIQWGLGGDIVVPGDYDGDRKTDFAVVRQGSPYIWYVLRSTNSQLQATAFGTKPQYATQGDYDGDGKTDVGVFDPVNGYFYYFASATQTTVSRAFGTNNDYPVANFDAH